ncbi:Pestheic acid cluster transcriptional regulator 3 [Fusarium oxysporum f. sp. albedinis]|nr:Pestheic acid cluster transcriptional regulator 3 [Fusarium oxysporum f. sp. albedinis]
MGLTRSAPHQETQTSSGWVIRSSAGLSPRGATNDAERAGSQTARPRIDTTPWGNSGVGSSHSAFITWLLSEESYTALLHA